MAIVQCDCGEQHYPMIWSDEEKCMKSMPDEFVVGTIDVTIAGHGTWRVPKIYIAVHGMVGRDVPNLAEQYGWERLDG
jgi:hypothetical protein